MEQAAFMAVQYDYDGAIELLKSQPDYESNTDMQSAVSDYENTKPPVQNIRWSRSRTCSSIH